MTLGTYACCQRPVLPHHRHCPVCHALYPMADEGHVCPGEALRQVAAAVVQAWVRHEPFVGWEMEGFDELIDALCVALERGKVHERPIHL